MSSSGASGGSIKIFPVLDKGMEVEEMRDIIFQAFKRSAINFDPDKIYDWQIGAIESCIRNETTLVAIPTGGGKTLVFQLAPVVLSIIAKKPQYALIISPLLALIKKSVANVP